MNKLFLVRALNEYDILCNPEKNGLASKKLLFECTKKYLESRESDYLNTLSKEEKDKYIYDNIKEYINSHNTRLEKKFIKGNKKVSNTIIDFYENGNKNAYYYMLQYLSTLNSHLISGSKINTDWISTSCSLDGILKYYDKQKEHKIVLIDTYTNGICNGETFVVDVSDYDIINNIKCLGKKIDKEIVDCFVEEIANNNDVDISNKLFHEYLFDKTKLQSRGYKYSTKSDEVCIYNYVKSDEIVAILEQLHVDLMLSNLFNEKYLLLSKNEQKIEFEKLKRKLRNKVLEMNDSYLNYVFDSLYLKNENISFITNNDFEKKKMEAARVKILRKSLSIPTSIIK